MTTEVHMSVVDGLWRVIEPWLAAERLELDDLELKGSGAGQTLRVVVDGEGGVDLDHLARLSNGISRLLDEQPGPDGPYQLEVSSPGLERQLRRPAHYRKSVGREVYVKARRGDQTVVVRGVIENADERSFTVATEEGTSEVFDYTDILKAKTVFRWERAPKPGKK